MRKIAALLAVLAVAGGIAGPALGASGSRLLESSLVGSPGPNRPMRSVASGGVPWTIDEDSEVRPSASGRLRADIEGLLIVGTGNPSLDGTTGRVTGVVASLTCENPTSGSAGTPGIVSTAPAPLSSGGDARIDEDVALPETCLGPIVLLRANSDSGPWIAATGF